MIIAIDGPAAAGKGTLALRLATELGFAHLDTGRIYRAVAAKVLAAGAAPDDAAAAVRAAGTLRPEDLERGDLRREEVGQGASVVAAVPQVRAALLAFQRHFAEHPPGGQAGAVLDGRDIGTVVCPGAEVKFYVTASPEIRARRRHKELLESGERSIYARVLQEVRDRDARDSGREAAPLRPAEDAVVLDTTEMNADAVLAAALGHILSRHPAIRP
ncbi:MAG: cytidylate kinase [Rhodospirillales bacterium]|nr:cytidylate kinase [Rhodospirillales bacterium]MDH3913089.1 cytidylate kinase [Rhodospirillales bacterium]MDH3967132.1 cytidylate kinase [Rhodospirillales bacterium]